MSDFLASHTPGEADRYARILSNLTRTEPTKISTRHGVWGSVAVVENQYPGYRVYEDHRSIAVVVGGPLLRAPAGKDCLVSCPSRHTATVLRHIFENPAGDWHHDLLGPFCFLHIDKPSGRFTVVTDNLSFIPVYEAESAVDKTQVLSTHSDAAALAACRSRPPDFDPVSVADFILHQKVTYPHTLYRAVRELAPATVHTIAPGQHTEAIYWRPQGRYRPFQKLDDAAAAAREALEDLLQRAANEHGRLTFFLSAGEDSRTLASMAPSDVDLHCITIAPSKNREARIAERVARRLKASWEFVEQPPDNYLHDLGHRSLLSGSGGLSIHAHMFGIAQHSSLPEQPVVIGGFGSDAFLKGHFYKLKRVRPGLGYERFVENRENSDVGRALPIEDDIYEEVAARRLRHEARLREFRDSAVNEWMVCWPMSQDHEIVNFWSNRRLFSSLEAFFSPAILDIAASIPPSWVINRRMFQRLAGPALKRTRWIPHGEGHFPALPWYANMALKPAVRIGRRLMRGGRRGRYPYAWPSAASCVDSEEFTRLAKRLLVSVEDSDAVRQAARVARLSSADAMQRFAAVQLLGSMVALPPSAE
ncbi:MAG: hypothetical protein DWQ37_11195 [Planctomycetota bacterium]|nr:MAG: hypothetical protein DWQ37_11195 [Planctomycetota bacterium]